MELKKFARARVGSKQENSINLKRLIGANIAAGLGVSGMKGAAEETIERALKKRWPKIRPAVKGAIKRGVPGALSGVLFGLATAYGLRKPKKRKR